MDLLNKIVSDIIRQHEGGEGFFEAIDKAAQNISILRELIKLSIHPQLPELWYYTIVSGNFGKFFINWWSTHPLSVLWPRPILVSGNLRNCPENMESLEYLGDRIKDNKYVFIDDSFYLGRTRDAINAELNKYGSKIIKTLVVYDGSHKNDPNVVSLYRYHEVK